MMPQSVTVRVRRSSGRRFRIWVPVLPALLLLSPLVVLAVVGAVIACRIYRTSPHRALGTGWGLVSALPGTRFDIEHERTAVLVKIR